jgi:signal transduction histidine kinase
MTQQLWQASKLATMGELAASIAHELNNPLATISLHTELLADSLAPDDPGRQPLLVIDQEVRRMATLVGNLLVFSRRSHQQLSTLDICDELTSTLDFIQYHLRGNNIDIVKDYASGRPKVQGDRQQLRQVFLNLITNASDAMPRGGTLTVRSHTGVMANDQQAVVVEFSDTGTGVQTGDLPKLWEPFFTTKPEGKGTGLGLAICRRTVEEHRGTIEIETDPGKGITVRITLPATDNGSEVVT